MDGTAFSFRILMSLEALQHLELLADRPDRLREMGRNGRERAKRLFSPDVVRVAR